MTEKYQDIRRWIAALEGRARALLNAYGSARRQGYQVKAERCPKHADGCAWVQYGILAEHITWADEDPGLLAERMVATMLPKGP
jgi:hypothetical protein